MNICRNTSVREIIETYPLSLEVFEKHGVVVEHECPDAVLDFELEDCESMCHIEDIDALISDLNELLR